jgi:uncharacterized protein DUF3850
VTITPNPDRRWHRLKTWPDFFESVESGEKTFEVRSIADRSFEVADRLLLVEYDPELGVETGRTLRRRVSYVLVGPMFGIEAGHAALAITEVPNLISDVCDECGHRRYRHEHAGCQECPQGAGDSCPAPAFEVVDALPAEIAQVTR